MKERAEARRFAEELDRLLQPTLLAGSDHAASASTLDSALLAAAERLASLPSLLPPPDPAFEQRVWARLRVSEAVTARPRRPALRLGWQWFAPVAALLLLVVLVLPGPRQALGNWMARFRVGKVEVAVAPEEAVRPQLVGKSQVYASLAAAEAASGFALLQPAYLPAGYSLRSVEAVAFDGLPLWMQPLYVEADYRPTDAQSTGGYYATLRQFNAGRPGDIQVGQVEFQSEAVRAAQDITLPNGLPAVLVEFESGAARDDVVLRQLIWEQDNMTLELWSQALPVDEMARIAASLQ